MKKNKQDNTETEHVNGAGAGGRSGLLGFGKLISGRSAGAKPGPRVAGTEKRRKENVQKQMVFHEVVGICTARGNTCHDSLSAMYLPHI